MAERVLLANATLANLRKIATRGMLHDFLYRLTNDYVQVFDDFTSPTFDTTNDWLVNGVGTEAPALVANTANGELNLVTTNTSGDSNSLYKSGRNWSPDNNCFISVRLKLPSIAAIKVEIGFTDSAASAVVGATANGSVNSLAATPTLNTGASDAVCAIMDTASGLVTPGNWRLVAAKAGVTQLLTPTVTVPALVAPVAATYQTVTVALVRNELGATDDATARLYVNGQLMGQITSAITTLANLNPYVIAVTRAAAAKTVTVDFVRIGQQRDTTA